jgi:hypothetical protein
MNFSASILRRLADGRYFGSVAARGLEFNHLSESRPLRPAAVAIRRWRQREADEPA